MNIQVDVRYMEYVVESFSDMSKQLAGLAMDLEHAGRILSRQSAFDGTHQELTEILDQIDKEKVKLKRLAGVLGKSGDIYRETEMIVEDKIQLSK